MASGASVNETLFQAIADPFFGEREAIKLAYGEDGSPTIEQTTAHYSMADAQPISLEPLVVPDTDLEGVNADQVFDVTAADVIGLMGLDSSGNSETDYYSFTAQAGTVINLQVMSAVLDRPQGAFDTTMTVYDSSGNIVEFNDDSFQDTDSTIIDLTLPKTGTYYVEVTPYSAPGQPSHQTGAYELFMYTFATDGDPPAGDTMYGGSGTDTLIAGAGDDTIAAQLPKDTIVKGSGTASVASFAPYLDVSAGTNATVNEGDYVTLTGSFIDPMGNPTHSYKWQVVASNGQEIPEGDGPTFTFSPGDAGTYTVTYTASDLNGGSGTAQVVIMANAVVPTFTAPTTAQTAIAGVSTSINLGTLTVKGIGPFTDEIDWGDGQSSTFSPSGTGSLSLAHTYATAGTFKVSELISDLDGETATASFSVSVTAPYTTTTLSPSTGTVMYGQSTTFTATVTGQGTPTGTVAFYLGTVNPGDEIGSGTLSVQGGLDIATFSTPILPVTQSPYSITAVYGGDSIFLGSTSNVATLTVTADATAISASGSGGAFGQSVTLTATVTAKAPGSGTPTGTVDFFDTTTNDDLGKATLSGGVAALSITALPPGSQSIAATYSGSSNFLSSSTTLPAITIGQSVIVLDPTAGGALNISGSASINVAGGVYVDSSSSSALEASGTAKITASVIDVHGGVSKSGSPSFSPAPVTKAATVADPLAGLPVPSTTGLSSYGSESVSGVTKATINQGIYSSISVSGSASLTMNPGLYIIEGGGFQVSGAGAVTGTGVTIYNTNSKFPSTGGTTGAISLSGSGAIKLTPATTGSYAGDLFIQPAANTQVLSFSGAAMAGVSGTIYAPSAQLAESGSASLNMALVVDTLTLSGAAVANGLILAAPTGTVAYDPAQIRTAYGINALSAGVSTPLDGTGQTIAIVDAYDDPSIFPALDAFDSQFGLTATGPSLYQQYGPAATFVTVLNQAGQPTSLPGSDPSGPGTDNWEVEEALDVEWTHAIAPGARIILVEANSQSLSDLMAGVAIAATQPGVSVVSMSWGFPERQAVFQSDEAAYDSVLTTPGVTFVASTGDFGAADPEYPAFSPNVVAVGGTSLFLNSDSSYNSETGWGYFSSALGTLIGSGGGISLYEPEPAYQEGVQSTGMRTTPDVSLVADPATGAWIADPYNLPGSDPFEVVGGTSLSAPAWAGLLVLVNQGRALSGEPSLDSSSPVETQQALYSLPKSDYNVIASGSNGYSANSGYNLVTGLGTPVANLLVSDLVAYQGPGTTYSGSPVGPLQDASLTDSGSVALGPMNVFDSLTITSIGLASLHDQSSTAGSNPSLLAMPPAIASNGASITLAIGAGFISGSSPGSLLADAAASSISALPGRSPAGLMSLTSTQDTPTPASSPLITRPVSLKPLVRPQAQRADQSPAVWEDPPGLQSTTSGEEQGLIVVARRSGTLPDSVLDELVVSFVSSPSREVDRADADPDRLSNQVAVARVGQRGASSSSPYLAPGPAGPMSRVARPRQTGHPVARLADLLMIGGLFGFGAGLAAVRNPQTKSASSKRPFITFKRR